MTVIETTMPISADADFVALYGQEIADAKTRVHNAAELVHFNPNSKRYRQGLDRALMEEHRAMLRWLDEQEAIAAGPPTLPATPTPSGKGLTVWCRYCHRKHHHGAGVDGTLDGHRAAHCTNPDSLYRHTGYVLEIVPPT